MHLLQSDVSPLSYKYMCAFRPSYPLLLGYGVYKSLDVCCSPGVAFPDGCSTRPKECWVVENYQLKTCVRDDRKCMQGMPKFNFQPEVGKLACRQGVHVWRHLRLTVQPACNDLLVSICKRVGVGSVHDASIAERICVRVLWLACLAS